MPLKFVVVLAASESDGKGDEPLVEKGLDPISEKSPDQLSDVDTPVHDGDELAAAYELFGAPASSRPELEEAQHEDDLILDPENDEDLKMLRAKMKEWVVKRRTMELGELAKVSSQKDKERENYLNILINNLRRVHKEIRSEHATLKALFSQEKEAREDFVEH